MARSLNGNRIRDTRIALILCFSLVILTKQLFSVHTALHEIFDILGYLLVAACAIGRVYCTAFLGGHKNTALITYGPFSISRNPTLFLLVPGCLRHCADVEPCHFICAVADTFLLGIFRNDPPRGSISNRTFWRGLPCLLRRHATVFSKTFTVSRARNHPHASKIFGQSCTRRCLVVFSTAIF
jgi:hypothetical protein